MNLQDLLNKHGLTQDLLTKKGRLPVELNWVREARSALVSELHATGMAWLDIQALTGLSNGSIQRLTIAKGNPASKAKIKNQAAALGKTWKGKSRHEQLKQQWAKGDYDRPSTRAKYSATAVRLLRENPKRGYGAGKSETLIVVKDEQGSIRVRSSYERVAVKRLESDPSVLSFQYECPLVTQDGRTILPDFLVHTTDGATTLVEVKPNYVLADPVRFAAQNARLLRASKEASLRGWHFIVWTEKELQC